MSQAGSASWQADKASKAAYGVRQMTPDEPNAQRTGTRRNLSPCLETQARKPINQYSTGANARRKQCTLQKGAPVPGAGWNGEALDLGYAAVRYLLRGGCASQPQLLQLGFERQAHLRGKGGRNECPTIAFYI